MNKVIAVAVAASALLSSEPTPAKATDFTAWNDHAPPYSFRFDNELDEHQSSRLTADGILVGFLYIQFTGTRTQDGYRIATHAPCETSRCSVGWTFTARRRSAVLTDDDRSDYPLFFMDRAEIVQPGAFNHFHWTGTLPVVGERTRGYLLQLVAADRFCFVPNAAQAATSSKTCSDNDGIALDLGVDMASHLNIVPAAPVDEGR